MFSTVGFEGTLEVNVDETITIEIELKDSLTNSYLEGATVTYSWEYGIGTFIEKGNGKYELIITLPGGLIGGFKMDLIISMESNLYKTAQSSFFITISDIERPNLFLWIIVLGLIGAASVFGIMSLRSYMILPKRRKKAEALLLRTQNFKDMRNLRAIVLIHKRSGLLMHAKSYSFLDDENKLLFSGFTQALIQFAESLYDEKDLKAEEKAKAKGKDRGRMLDLDFKYFQCLIYDLFELRTIFILEEPASESLKKIIINLSEALLSECKEQIETFNGLLEELESLFPPIIAKYVDLYYKEPFKITENKPYLLQFKESGELTKMATRVLNVINSFAESGEKFEFSDIFELIHEKNEDLIIDAIELLKDNKLILPFSTVEKIGGKKAGGTSSYK